jgi:RNA recognition motif-containing protein
VTFATAEELQEACANVNGSFWHGRRITCIPRSPDESSAPRAKRGIPSEPTSQLFIGNIPYETTDAELNRLFKGMDNLRDVRVAVDRTTGWPRGFAHADFATVEAATSAKNKLEGAMLGDRRLRIDYAAGYQRRNSAPRQSSDSEE